MKKELVNNVYNAEDSISDDIDNKDTDLSDINKDIDEFIQSVTDAGFNDNKIKGLDNLINSISNDIADDDFFDADKDFQDLDILVDSDINTTNALNEINKIIKKFSYTKLAFKDVCKALAQNYLVGIVTDIKHVNKKLGTKVAIKKSVAELNE